MLLPSELPNEHVYIPQHLTKLQYRRYRHILASFVAVSPRFEFPATTTLTPPPWLAAVRAGGGGGLEVPPLACTRWELRMQQRLETAENVGFRSTSLFDHLLQQSLQRPNGTVGSGTVPAGSLLVTTGQPWATVSYKSATGLLLVTAWAR